MVAWSSSGLKTIANINVLRSVIASSKNGSLKKAINYVPVRSCGHERTMKFETSRYNWTKFKDLLIFYGLLGVIPIGLLITYTNVFIGDAQLAITPEGYEPKHWEYHRHPITRFIARYLAQNPQESYERNMHHAYAWAEKTAIKKLENRILDLMSDREDYQSWFFHPAEVPKYARKTKEIIENLEFTHKGRGPTDVL